MENHWVWSRLALGSVLPFHFFPEDRKVCRTFTAVTGLSEEKAQDNMNEWMNISVRQMYSMRIQDEDASLAAGVKQDAALDRWRTMHERLRNSVLQADRSGLLAAYSGLFRQFIPELLQVQLPLLSRRTPFVAPLACLQDVYP